MGYEMNYPLPVESGRSERATFIRRTYAHLAGAIAVFIGIEALIFGLVRPNVAGFDTMMLQYFRSPFLPLILLVAFIGCSYLARYWAMQGGSAGLQYAGLALYVVVEALIFVPLLWYAMAWLGDTRTVAQAGVLSLCLFAGLTAVVFISGKDFSFLGPIIAIAGFVALGVVICAIFIGTGLGLWFSLAMIALAAAAILYDTSNILYQYRMDQHVAAALSLFASVAMLFYYILLALLQSRGR